MGAFHSTLTLAGIAGIILTVGMAVDANVLVFRGAWGRRDASRANVAIGDRPGAFDRAFGSIHRHLRDDDRLGALPLPVRHRPHQGLRRHPDDRSFGRALHPPSSSAASSSTSGCRAAGCYNLTMSPALPGHQLRLHAAAKLGIVLASGAPGRGRHPRRPRPGRQASQHRHRLRRWHPDGGALLRRSCRSTTWRRTLESQGSPTPSITSVGGKKNSNQVLIKTAVSKNEAGSREERILGRLRQDLQPGNCRQGRP